MSAEDHFAETQRNVINCCRLAVAVAVIKSKPVNLSVAEHCNQLKDKLCKPSPCEKGIQASSSKDKDHPHTRSDRSTVSECMYVERPQTSSHSTTALAFQPNETMTFESFGRRLSELLHRLSSANCSADDTHKLLLDTIDAVSAGVDLIFNRPDPASCAYCEFQQCILSTIRCILQVDSKRALSSYFASGHKSCLHLIALANVLINRCLTEDWLNIGAFTATELVMPLLKTLLARNDCCFAILKSLLSSTYEVLQLAELRLCQQEGALFLLAELPYLLSGCLENHLLLCHEKELLTDLMSKCCDDVKYYYPTIAIISKRRLMALLR